MHPYRIYKHYRMKKSPVPGRHAARKTIGLAVIALAFGGILRPTLPTILAEANYQKDALSASIQNKINPPQEFPQSVPVLFNPLFDQAGNPIEPVNTDFSIIVPVAGINAPVVANVDPANTEEYHEALLSGVAHAKMSYLPDQNGTVYLFSHSTNYEWYVKDLNAIFYTLKNVEPGDWIVLLYKNTRYTYQVAKKEIVAPTAVEYIQPQEGSRTLILQTCWPPGSTTERLLVFADLFEVHKISQ
jgi:LPXTG-site transpeptidase (sortase) family protein